MAPDGVVKVTAGAGTGKTTALMARVMYLIERGVPAPAIRAITFTRKAANEFTERLTREVGESVARQVKLGTFHAYCARFLRKHTALAGLESERFLIADDDDIRALIERAVTESGVVPEFEEPQRNPDHTEAQHKALIKVAQREREKVIKEIAEEAQKAIARWKESGLTVDMIADPSRPHRSAQQEINARIYLSYQDALTRRNMVDFADLILKTVGIFEDYPDIRDQESSRIRYLLVDEFQDCNLTQAKLVEHLASYHRNLMVVGDPDQSIYAFRAACPAIMEGLSGEGVIEITLTNNRRSTQTILDAANLVVDYMPGRAEPKVLNSALDIADQDSSVRVLKFDDDYKEAFETASEISRLIAKGVRPSEIAILLRMSRMSVPLEEQLIRKRIAYRVWKGTSLLDRAEMRDLLAYLKLAANPFLDTSFERVVNRPARGLGDAALRSITGIAEANGIVFADACGHFGAHAAGTRVRQEAKDAALALGRLLNDLTDLARNDATPVNLLELVLRETHYREWVRQENPDNVHTHLGNIELLLDLASEYDDVFEFLNDIYLFTDTDVSTKGADVVQIMTIHASKGLEFDYVFVPGLEDGTLPHKSAREDDAFVGSLADPWVGPNLGGTNEERCLCHVAFTRARRGLTVSYARKRGFGAPQAMEPSQFLAESNLLQLTMRPTPPAPKPRRSRAPEADHSYRRPIAFGPRP